MQPDSIEGGGGVMGMGLFFTLFYPKGPLSMLGFSFTLCWKKSNCCGRWQRRSSPTANTLQESVNAYLPPAERTTGFTHTHTHTKCQVLNANANAKPASATIRLGREPITLYLHSPPFTTAGAHSCSWACRGDDMWA